MFGNISFTMAEEICVKWYIAMEEYVRCPVCLNVSQDIQHQCIYGHHVCELCRVYLSSCPTCKSPFIATRNLVAEQASAKLHDIKLSLSNPRMYNKVSVATQTEVVCIPTITSACQTDPINEDILSRIVIPRSQHSAINFAPRAGKGLFPCRIGSCTVEVPHGRMIPHLRFHHNNVFSEFARNTGFDRFSSTVFKKKWTFNHHLNQNYDFAFYIKEMGVFFLKISTNRRGHLSAFVQIVNCANVAQQFIYKLETVVASYTGPVKTCRLNPDRISNDRLYVHSDIRRMIDDKGFFYLNLTIKRKFHYNSP